VYSLLVNLGLAGIKGGLAFFSGSLALAADAIHSATDVFASVAVLVGLFLSRRKSKTFPYGLYKVENVVSIAISFLIFLAGYEVAREAFQSTGTHPKLSPWLLAGVAVTTIVPLLFGRYEMAVGQRTGSPSLVADGRHFQTDVASSLAVLAAVAAGLLGLQLDRIAAGLIVLFIGYSGWGLLVEGMRVLLDASLDVGTLQQVRSIMQGDPAVAAVVSVTGRNSGRYRFLEAEVLLRVSDLEKAHRVSQRLEEAVRTEVPRIDRVLIHYEPMARSHLRYAIPLADTAGTLSEHLGDAPYFALATVRTTDGVLERQEIQVNPHTGLPKAKGIRVAEWLVGQKCDVVLLKEDLKGKGPAYVFAGAGVELREIQGETLAEVLHEEVARWHQRAE
jgi:cation diffusion facilitator family transporter